MVEKAQTVWLNKDDTSAIRVTFENRKNAGLGIKKMDSITKEPLADAIFKITDSKGQVVGTTNGLFRTDEKGFIHIPNLTPGAYVVQEIQSPDGYVLENTPQTVHIEYGKLHTLEFFNTPKTSILIKKCDSETREPLTNAVFKVTDSIGEYRTDETGTIIVTCLKQGTYKVQEIQAPNGYVLDNTVKLVYLKQGEPQKVEIFNSKKAGIQILKKDSPKRKTTFRC